MTPPPADKATCQINTKTSASLCPLQRNLSSTEHRRPETDLLPPDLHEEVSKDKAQNLHSNVCPWQNVCPSLLHHLCEQCFNCATLFRLVGIRREDSNRIKIKCTTHTVTQIRRASTAPRTRTASACTEHRTSRNASASRTRPGSCRANSSSSLTRLYKSLTTAPQYQCNPLMLLPPTST